jgi:hypothetical protein
VFELERRDTRPVLTTFPKLRIFSFGFAAALAAVCCCALFAAGATSTTYTVDNPSDSVSPGACTGAVDDCTLRGAIALANADPATDTIDFDIAPPGTLSIDDPLPAITEKLTIVGGGNTSIVGSPADASAYCAGAEYALDASGAQVQVLSLAIRGVCGRAIASPVAPPQIRIGPRRADNTVPINGAAPSGAVEIFRADAPADPGEALSFVTGVPAAGGGYAYVPPAEPAPSEKFTATFTDTNNVTSTFAQPVSAPADLVSPTLVRAVGVSNNTVRLDFDEPVAGVGGTPSAFSLVMGGVPRQITSVDVAGASVYVGSQTTPWATGEAGSIGINGTPRVTDMMGNELLGNPTAFVWAGPGEIAPPLIQKLRLRPRTFCRKKTSKCTKRKQTYLYVTVNKPSRVTFTIVRGKKQKFVVRYVRKLPAGTTKTRLLARMNGRLVPLGKLSVRAVAEDQARNLSAPVMAEFTTVSRNSKL